MSKSGRSVAVLLGVGLVVAFVGPTVAGPASASSPPGRLCWVSGGAFEELAEEEDIPVEVERSTIRIDVHEDGTATVRVRNRINRSAATRLETDLDAFEAIRGAVVERVEWEGVEGRDAAVRLQGDVVRITYSLEGFVRKTGDGSVLVDGFADRPHGYVVDADRLELRPPDGWAVANHPATGAVRSIETDGGEKVVWTDWQISENTYVVLAPDDGPLARAKAQLAIAADVGPTMLGHAVMAGAPSSIVLWLAFMACRGLPDPADDPAAPRSRTERLKNAILPIAIVLAPILLVLPITPIGGFGPPFVAVGLGVFTTIVASFGVVFCRLEK